MCVCENKARSIDSRRSLPGYDGCRNVLFRKIELLYFFIFFYCQYRVVLPKMLYTI